MIHKSHVDSLVLQLVEFGSRDARGLTGRVGTGSEVYVVQLCKVCASDPLLDVERRVLTLIPWCDLLQTILEIRTLVICFVLQPEKLL